MASEPFRHSFFDVLAKGDPNDDAGYAFTIFRRVVQFHRGSQWESSKPGRVFVEREYRCLGAKVFAAKLIWGLLPVLTIIFLSVIENLFGWSK